MAATNDVITNKIDVGDIVNVPCQITSIGATSNGIPVLGLTCKYTRPDGAAVTIATVYATQVIKDR